MRYDKRTDLIKLGDESSLHGSSDKTVASNVPCGTIAITDTQALATFGLTNTTAFEMHFPGTVVGIDRVKLDGVEYTVNKTFSSRHKTIFIISGGG